MTTKESLKEHSPPVPRFHHVGVQTTDLNNCVSWYRDFFGCHETWTLDEFSDLTMSRLPGIARLIEMRVGDVRFHLFERDGGRAAPPPGDGIVQFQHLCMTADTVEELRGWRERWIELFASGRYSFDLPEPPTEIVTDDDGVKSFYAYDVNGLEFEFTHIPRGSR